MTLDLSAAGLASWSAKTLIPAWIDRAVRASGAGYHENFHPDGRPIEQDVSTALVTSRLVYTFSHAHELYPGTCDLSAAEHGFALLRRAQTVNGYVPKTFAADGTTREPVADLYDLAFVLFACARYGSATGDPAALAMAEETQAFIAERLVHPAGGFREDTLGTLPRRQNPHMHLLEAYHALAEVTGEAIWIAAAQDMVALFERCLLDEDGLLAEYFEDDWRPAPGRPGLVREPGHQFEWVWLLHRHQRWHPSGALLTRADRLYDFALAQGMDRRSGRRGLVVDAVEPDGAVMEGTKRLWPQTEAIKALAVRFEATRDAAVLAQLRTHLAVMFDLYIDPASGLWHNQLSEADAPIVQPIPVRVLYHLFLCLTEAIRVQTGTKGITFVTDDWEGYHRSIP